MFIFYTLLSFLTFWTLFKNDIDKAPNFLLKLSLTLFLSTYISTIIIFLIACFLSFFTENLLSKATYLYLSLVFIILFLKLNVLKEIVKDLVNAGIKHSFWKTVYFIIFILSIYAFFHNHLRLDQNRILISSVYWDFTWHIRLIENFFQGDNFPPQNESFAGIYHIYHYLWSIIPAIYRVFGLNIAQAINIYTTFFLFGLITAAVGIVQLFYKGRLAFFLVPFFILTHGSFKIIDHLNNILKGNTTLTNLLIFTRPDLIDFNKNGAFGYNGNMINIFYFLEERQLIFACFALLIFIFFLLYIDKFSNKFTLLMAFLFGLFLQWHLFVWIMMVIISTIYILSRLPAIQTKQERKKYLFFLSIFLFISSISFLLLKGYISSHPDFNTDYLKNFPKFNVNFSTNPPEYTFSLIHIVLYYFYLYGIRLLLYIGAYIYFFYKEKKIFLFLLCLIPIFIMINTLQISPLSIYDNHKLLKPLTMVFDIFAIAALFSITKKLKFRLLFITLIIFISTVSGTVSFLSFFMKYPQVVYARYSKPIYETIKTTPKKSVFLTDDDIYVFLAGRKTYYAAYLGQNLGINSASRKKITKKVSKMNTKEDVCSYLQKQNLMQKIHYVYLEARLFLDVEKECNK